MIRLDLPRSRSPLRILCLGAHSDDIEIGCGGAILRLLAERKARVHWVVFSATSTRAREARKGASLFLQGSHTSAVAVRRFRDGYFPAQFAAIKDEFERLKKRISPDLIFSPWRRDAHQDHRTVAELAWNTFRDHLILEYEIPKWDADLTPPNLYVELTAVIARRKAELIRETFTSQADRHWFNAETFLGLAHLRGIECRAPEGYAEAFHARKLAL